MVVKFVGLLLFRTEESGVNDPTVAALKQLKEELAQRTKKLGEAQGKMIFF